MRWLLGLSFLSLIAAAGSAKTDEPAPPPDADCAKIQQQLGTAFAVKEMSDWLNRVSVDGIVSADDFAAAIAAAQARGDVEQAVRVALRAVLLPPATADFSGRLLRLVNCVEAAERVAGPLPEPIVSRIFDAAASMPKDHPVFQVGQLTRAMHHGHVGDFWTQAALAESVLATPALAERLRPVVHTVLGSAQEGMGHAREAANAYRTAVDAMQPGFEQTHLLLRLVFLQLHLREYDAAENALTQLRGMPLHVLALIDGGEQVQRLESLVKTGRAREYWERSRKWWAEWESLATRLRLPPAGGETVVPLIAGPATMAALVNPALQTGNAKLLFQALRRVVSAARWLPPHAEQAAEFADYVIRVAPGAAAAYRQVVIAMLEAAREADTVAEEQNEMLLQLARLYSAEGKIDQTLSILHAVRGRVTDLSFRARVDQAWGYAAILGRTELAESATALRADFDDGAPFANRAAALDLLAELYAWQDDRSAQAAILKRELDHPAVKADRSAWAQLAVRLEIAEGKDLEPVPGKIGEPPPLAAEEVGPKAIRKVPAVYPATLQRAGVKGTVMLDFLVDARGVVIAANVVSSPNAMLSELALAAIGKWEFEPAMRGGRPVGMRMHVPLSFGLDASPTRSAQ